jgi:hypothetical protein
MARERLVIERPGRREFSSVMSSRSPRPGVHIETLHDPQLYTPRQVDRACVVADALKRGRFVLVERPERIPG